MIVIALVLSIALNVWLAFLLYIRTQLNRSLQDAREVWKELCEKRWTEVSDLAEARDLLAKKLKEANEQIGRLGKDLQIARETIQRVQRLSDAYQKANHHISNLLRSVHAMADVTKLPPLFPKHEVLLASMPKATPEHEIMLASIPTRDREPGTRPSQVEGQ